METNTNNDAFEIGELVSGKGVFIGAKDWIERSGYNLGRFNFFTTLYDLGLDATGQGKKLTLGFNGAVIGTAKIRNLFGHHGADLKDTSAIHQAVSAGRYKGEWIMPSLTEACDFLYKNKDKGVLKGTFTEAWLGQRAHCYWTNSHAGLIYPDHRHFVDFKTGKSGIIEHYLDALSIRPIRAEPAPTAPAP